MPKSVVKWSIQPKTSWKDDFGDVELKPWLVSAEGEERSYREMPQKTSLDMGQTR